MRWNTPNQNHNHSFNCVDLIIIIKIKIQTTYLYFSLTTTYPIRKLHPPHIRKRICVNVKVVCINITSLSDTSITHTHTTWVCRARVILRFKTIVGQGWTGWDTGQPVIFIHRVVFKIKKRLKNQKPIETITLDFLKFKSLYTHTTNYLLKILLINIIFDMTTKMSLVIHF